MAFFGARYYDPVLGIWLCHDPAIQFNNPCGFGGDPINYMDPDGEFVITAMVVGGIIGAYMGAAIESGSWNLTGYDITEDWDETLLGAGVGALSGAAGAGTGALFSNSLAAGAAGGATGGFGNYSLAQYSQGSAGFQSWSGSDAWGATWRGGLSGAVGGLAGSAVATNISGAWYSLAGDLSGFIAGGMAGGATGGVISALDQ